jgi:rubredoxin
MASASSIWRCQTSNCGYLYDSARGDRKGKIPKGVPFEELPEDWKCPICGAGKKMFQPLLPAGASSS